MSLRRIGIVGLGMAVAPHARSLLDLKDRVQVARAFSPSAERRRAFADRFGFPLADSLEAVLSDSGVDAVLILTPPNTHLELVRRAAEAGKHILLEKPLEISTERALEVVRVCRTCGVTLGVVLQHRFRPVAQKMAGLLKAGELGQILGASASIRLWRPQSYYDEPGRGTKARDGGGVLLTQGIHTLDLLVSLVGQAADVMSYVTTTPIHRMETEDLVAAAVRYRNGALGTIEATTAAFPGYPERIDIMGELGHAAISGTSLHVAFIDGRKVEVASDSMAGGTGADPMAFPHDYHRALITDFLDALDGGTAPTVTGEEALKVHMLINAIVESGQSGMPVSVPSA
ncbi:Gfo/Idh/MocA family protein [Dongia deserti]|uniref:Gfo/Idh/MocA family protein n=1 Tax=Dongia deserti TaxID=2268030 RepID=UPI000E6541F5|nr:Gfo/Idh/MocA family oxidoreductase [Dongia deserti]